MTQNAMQTEKSRSFPEQSVFVSSIPSSMAAAGEEGRFSKRHLKALIQLLVTSPRHYSSNASKSRQHPC